jgi:hypothetical protein
MFIVPEYVNEWYLNLKTQKPKTSFVYFKNRETPEIAKWFDGLPYSRRVVYKILKEGKKEFGIFVCSFCGKRLTESQILEDSVCCSRSCSMSITSNNEKVKEKKKETFLKHYGVENSLLSKELKNKIEETNLRKYGAKNVFASEIIKKRIEETNLEKYGVKNATQSEVVKSKIRKTYLKKYGTENIQNLEWIKEKKRQTSLKHYGTDSPLQNKELREESQKRHREKFGCDFPTQRKDVQDRMKRTNRGKNWETFLKSLNARMINPLFEKDAYVDGKSENFHFKCMLCGTEFNCAETQAIHIHCPHCIKTARSVKERQFLDFIKEIYNGEIIENDRSVLGRKELDAYIPQKKLAFEFDGNYWHSTLKKDKLYHQNKSIECRNKGVRLVHIFEWEWERKRDKVENLIKSALGIFEKRIYARKCCVCGIEFSVYKEFLESYHLQGSVNSSLRFGLFLKDELVAVMGFGKSRFGKDEMELQRFCVKGGYSVIGGFSKLLKHSGVKSCISFVDFAHFNGEGYRKIGFAEVSLTPPSYIYRKYQTVLSRYECQKHKLKDVLGEAFDPTLTEKDNMLKEDYQIIYDCGNLKMCYTTNV